MKLSDARGSCSKQRAERIDLTKQLPKCHSERSEESLIIFRTNLTREKWFAASFTAECTIELSLETASNRGGNTQEGCRNGGGILARAFVLAGKQLFQLSLQISRSAVLFCGFECIHGRPVVFPEFIDEGCRCTREIEDKRVTREGDFLGGNSCAGKPLDHVALDAPRHWTNETFRRWRRVG